MSEICHIIVAAGSGRRFGSPLPKQFVDLLGKPVLMHTVSALRRATPGAEIILVLNRDYFDLWHDLCAAHAFTSPVVVAGGATRCDSVAAALATAEAAGARTISVHDGARPIPDAEMIRRVITAAHTPGFCGALPGLEPTDSLRVMTPEGKSKSVVRSSYRAVQTPQAFPGRVLREAYAALGSNSAMTDDASVTEAFSGLCPLIVEGDPCNIKITRDGDIQTVEMLISRHNIPLP